MTVPPAPLRRFDEERAVAPMETPRGGRACQAATTGILRRDTSNPHSGFAQAVHRGSQAAAVRQNRAPTGSAHCRPPETKERQPCSSQRFASQPCPQGVESFLDWFTWSNDVLRDLAGLRQRRFADNSYAAIVEHDSARDLRPDAPHRRSFPHAGPARHDPRRLPRPDGDWARSRSVAMNPLLPGRHRPRFYVDARPVSVNLEVRASIMHPTPVPPGLVR